MPFRRHETRRRAHAGPGGVHQSSSSASLSSFSSSTSSTLPAAPPSDSSHSVIAAFDRSLHSSPFSAFNNRLPPDTILPVTRSSSLYPTMGQSPSQPRQYPADPPPSPTVPVTPGSAGSRLKRVFGGRRKKSEDIPPSSSPTLALPPMVMGKSRSATTPSSSASSLSSAPRFPQQPSVSAGPAYPASSFTRHVPAELQSVPYSKPLPESPPPDPPNSLPSPSDKRSSIVIVPSSAALQNISGNEDAEDVSIVLRRPKKRDSDHEVMKDDWRKSDSTMTSYYTVRPRSGASGGTRTPRPVSMAESLQSTSTVVPAGKRLSALLTDAEFIMTEDMTRSGATALSRKTSPSEPSRARKSRSVSLSFTSPLSSNKPTTSASVDGHPSKPVFKHRPVGDVATLSKTAANGIIGPLHGGGSQSTGIRGNLAALSAATTVPPSLARPSPQQPPTSSGQHGSQRQPATTMIGGQAAGSAMRFYKGAAGFVRALGGLGGLGSSSGNPSSSPAITGMDDFGRSASNASLASHVSQTRTGKGKQRYTPNAPSGAWSVESLGSSATGQTDPESFVVTSPTLGICLRGPMMNSSGVPVASGLVFGRDLKACVQDTAVDAVRLAPATQGSSQTVSPVLLERRLPALVVRCVEHMMKWGVEEVGLFRVSGRTSHVAKLRAEFDTGADFDMLECHPSDLDPNAVASVFKTYLRDLPEPILTHALSPYFEAAMHTETKARRSFEEAATSARTAGVRPSLPSGPRDNPSLRKRPSLTTLMLPNFSSMRPPSRALLNTFAALVARLPQENRDLLRTVIDLINFVARREEIRMPLSNLTVVLCPTLNMNPPTLRVLCEAEGIWDGPPPEGWEDSTDLDAQRDIPDPVPGSQSPGRGLGQHVATEDSLAQGDLDDQSSGMEPNLGAWDTHTGRAQDEMHEDDKRLGPALDDRASDFSAGDSRPSTPAWGKGSPLDPWSPPALTSSSDSLTTPSMSSEAPSIPQVTAPTPLHPYRTKEKLIPSSIIPDFVRTSPVPSLQPATHPPVSFPGIGSVTAPTTPLSHRFSTDLQSLPLVRSESSSQSSKPTRMKRPSLTALFSKKSISSLRSSRLFSSSSSSSPYYDAEDSPSRSSPASLRRLGSSSPMISASSLLPQRSSSSLPPLLNSTIDSSSLNLAIRLKAGQAAKAGRTDTESHTAVSRESSSSPREADAPLSSSPITPVTAHSRSKSELPKLSLSKPEPLQPQLSEDSFVSLASPASYHGLSFLDDHHIGDGALRDEWARNVFSDLGWSPTTVEHAMPGKI